MKGMIKLIRAILELVILLATIFTRRSTSLTLVELCNDGLDDVLHLLLLRLHLVSISVSVLLQPGNLLIDHFFNFGSLLITELSSQLLLVAQLVLQRVGVALKLIPRLHLALQLGVLISELLSVIDHLLDVLGRQPILIVGDGDLLLGAGALVLSGHDQDTV